MPLVYSTYWKAQITNEDVDYTVTIYETKNVNPPTTSRGSVAPLGIVTGDTITKTVGGTFYAQAKMSGKTDSDIASLTLDPF